MMQYERMLIGIGAAVAACLTAVGTSWGQEFPQKEIRMIVPFPAGGATDVAARMLVPYLEKNLNGRIIVDNRPGAGGEVGFAELARAKPDGYTFGFINSPNVVTIPIQRKAQYSLSQITPIANIVTDPGAIAVKKDGKFKTLDDVVNAAKARPGEISYGTTGPGSDDHFAMMALEKKYGIKLNHIPFTGGAQLRQALLGGHLDVGVYNIGEMTGDLAAGSVVALGVMAAERFEGAPDVKTFKEQGVELIEGSDRGLAAPAGVPGDIMERYADAVQKMIQDPSFLELARKHPLPIGYMDGAAFSAKLAEMDKAYREIWARAPWSAE